MNSLKNYADLEARYRRLAEAEPDQREKHSANADAWRRLADTARLFSEKQVETRNRLAALETPWNDGK